MKYKIRKIEKRYKQNLKNAEERTNILEKSLVQLGSLHNIIWNEKDENSFKVKLFKNRLSIIRWNKIIPNKFVFCFLLFAFFIVFITNFKLNTILFKSVINLSNLLFSLFFLVVIIDHILSTYLVIKQKFKRKNVYRNSFLRLFLLYFIEIIKFVILPFFNKIITIIFASSVASISFCGVFLLYMNTQFWDELLKLDYSSLSIFPNIKEVGLGLLVLIILILSIISLLILKFSTTQALRWYHIKWKYLNINNLWAIIGQFLIVIATFIVLTITSKNKNNSILINLGFSIHIVVLYAAAIVLAEELSVEKKFRRKNKYLLQAFLENKL